MTVLQRIRQILHNHPVVLFMKGTPEYPMCGYSARASAALGECGGRFHAINVFEDPELRAYLPRFANWPTWPQLFINGELIGGCDILLELHATGALAGMLADFETV